MATKYISRDLAIDAIWKPEVRPNDLIFDALRRACEGEVKHIPAANVRPVVHGKWEPGETIFFCGEEHTAPRTCSVCGRSALDEPWYFCPNCGADMRGASDNG